MKPNYTKKITLGLCCGLLSITPFLSGCEKLVDAGDPLTTITTNQTFSRDGSALAALSGIYSQLINGIPSGNGPSFTFSNGGLMLYTGMSADELVNHDGVANKLDNDFVINKLDSRNSNNKQTLWTPLYKLIFNVNSLTEGVTASSSNQLTAATKKQLMAEAKFIRAFCYFYLTNLYGDVPLALSTDWKVNSQMARTAQSKVYEQIIKDLLDAQKDLPEDYVITGGERIRANKFAATALLARVYLYREDWKNAEMQSSAVIGNNQYQLEDDLNKVFLSTSREAIWQLKPSAASSQSAIYDARYFVPYFWWTDLSPAERPLYLLYFSELSMLYYPPYLMTPQLAAAFETGDQRKVMWTSYIETPATAPYSGSTDYFPKKYARLSNPYYAVFRLAEQFLIRAEARVHLDNLPGADQDVNAIRKRAGLEDINSGSASAALEAIAHERQTELFAEWGHRWFDLKRTGKASEVLTKIPGKQFEPFQLLYPIPQDELQIDPNLTQNPGY